MVSKTRTRRSRLERNYVIAAEVKPGSGLLRLRIGRRRPHLFLRNTLSLSLKRRMGIVGYLLRPYGAFPGRGCRRYRRRRSGVTGGGQSLGCPDRIRRWKLNSESAGFTPTYIYPTPQYVESGPCGGLPLRPSSHGL